MSTATTPPPALARQFAEWACAFALTDAPVAVLAAARRALLDTVGVMVAGGAHVNVRQLRHAWPVGGGVCHLATGGRTDAETAALVNGTAAHIWDFDDAHYSGVMHGSAVVLPTALALAEECCADDDDLLTAFIVGSEIAYCLGDWCTQRHYLRGWWSTATLGIVGATAAAARLLSCNAEQMTNAIGIAAAAAGVGRSVLGTHAKPVLAGECARRGVTFARIAAAGLNAPQDVFEHERGFFQLLNNGQRAAQTPAAPGRQWRLVEPGLFFKRHPVCSAAHTAIEQLPTLLSQTNADADDIAKVDVATPQLSCTSLTYPRPQSPQEAQFSMPYALACAALHGCVRLEDLTPEEIASPQKQSLMERVHLSAADDLSTEAMREKYPESARVVLHLNDGRTAESFCGAAHGTTEWPLSDDELVHKFHQCLACAGVTVDAVTPSTFKTLATVAQVCAGE